MKITDVRLSVPFYVPLRKMTDSINTIPTRIACAFVEVLTDEGLVGVSVGGGGTLSKVLTESILKPQVVDEDPMDSERIWQKMYWATVQQYGRRGVAISAISMVDIAIWDLKGKILNQPLHKLLGGYREIVPSYGSGVDLHYTNEELVREMTDYVADGFKMVKMKVGRKSPQEDLERVRLVREAIGPNVDLALDANMGWSLNTAIRMAKKLESYDIYWLEEPILADEIDNLARLSEATTIPIALGENHYTKWEFKDLMHRGSLRVVQADPGKCGGVTEFIKIAAIADAYGIPVCPHHVEYVDAALVAAIPNGLFHEYIREWFEPMGQIFSDPISPQNGQISPSTKPGLGIEVNWEAVERLREKPDNSEETKWVTCRGWRWPPYL